eukprot:15046301-Ditylum_brightwellii.AAC.1
MIKDSDLTVDGILLKKEVKAQAGYADYVSKLKQYLHCVGDSKQVKIIGSKEAPIANNFLHEAADLHGKNPEFCNSILVGVLKAAIEKLMTGNQTIKMEQS